MEIKWITTSDNWYLLKTRIVNDRLEWRMPKRIDGIYK